MAREFSTVSEVRAFIGLKTTDDDPVLAAIILRTTAWIENYTSRTFLQDTYSERRDAPGGDTLVLRHRPVTAVASVVLGNPGQAPWTAVPNLDYYFTESSLVWLRNPPRGRGQVLVNYTAGYEVLPWEIRDACVQITAWRYKEGRRVAEKSKLVGNETITYLTDAVPEAVKKTLDQWTNPVYA